MTDNVCESLFSFSSARKMHLVADVFINIAMPINNLAHYCIKHISALGMVVTIWNFCTWEVEA